MKVTLSVEYAKPDPELHTELFVKLPHDTDVIQKYVVECVLDQNQPEMAFNRLCAHR